MPNDAKLGLVVGVALVLAVAVVFFRKDASSAGESADTNVKSSPANATPPPSRPALARAMHRSLPAAPADPQPRTHTVVAGETYFSLAQRFYGDGAHGHLISRANRQEVDTAEPLAPGTVLVIPEMGETATKSEVSQSE